MVYENLAKNIEPFDSLTHHLRHLMQINNINEAMLARKTGIPQPTLHKILVGTTNDPRASTLKVLANFFNLSIDELLTGEEPLQQKNLLTKQKTQSIPIISWTECIDPINFLQSISPTTWNQWIVSEFLSENAFGIISKPSMEPRFPRGTILIIDPIIKPEDGDIALVHYPCTHEGTLREISIDGPQRLLIPLGTNNAPSSFDQDVKVLGILIKSTFSYQS